MIENKLINALEARILEIKDGLVTCPQPDHAAYRQQVGHVHGLQEALQTLHDLLHKDDE